MKSVCLDIHYLDKLQLLLLGVCWHLIWYFPTNVSNTLPSTALSNGVPIVLHLMSVVNVWLDLTSTIQTLHVCLSAIPPIVSSVMKDNLRHAILVCLDTKYQLINFHALLSLQTVLQAAITQQWTVYIIGQKINQNVWNVWITIFSTMECVIKKHVISMDAKYAKVGELLFSVQSVCKDYSLIKMDNVSNLNVTLL